MPDIIIYVGPLELGAVLGGIVALTVALTWAALHWQQRQNTARRLQAQLDELPYPALYFKHTALTQRNAAAEDWRANLGRLALVAAAARQRQNILRTIPIVERPTFQARAARLTHNTWFDARPNWQPCSLSPSATAAPHKWLFFSPLISHLASLPRQQPIPIQRRAGD